MTCVSKAIERRDRKWGACSTSALVAPAFATTAAWSFPVNLQRLRRWSLLMLFEQRDDFLIIHIFRILQGRAAVFVLAVDISSSAIR